MGRYNCVQQVGQTVGMPAPSDREDFDVYRRMKSRLDDWLWAEQFHKNALIRKCFEGDEEALAFVRYHPLHPCTELVLNRRVLIKDGVLVGARHHG